MKKLSLIILTALCASLASTAFAHTDHSVSTKTSANKRNWINAPRKPQGSDINLRYRYASAKPYYAVGETITLELELSGAVGKNPKVQLWQDAALSASAQSLKSAGLSKTQNGYARSLSALKQSMSISVTPSAEGLHYVHIQTEQDDKGSVAAIPIRVGNKPLNLPSTGEVKTLSDGRKIIEMKSS